MSEVFFTLVVWARDTKEMYFRDFMESMVAQTYDNWELYVIDEGQGAYISRITEEFFPGDDRVHYRKLKTHKGQAYGYNIGLHFVLLDTKRQGKTQYLVFANQHDRLSPRTLEMMAEQADLGKELIYTDHDELIDTERMNPHFKPGHNRELLLHKNYIGEFFAISYEAVKRVGEFREKLQYASIYDYLLRADEAEISFGRVPQLLYHKRIFPIADYKAKRKETERSNAEQNLVIEAAKQRRSVEVGDAYFHENEYLFLREKGVRPLSRHNIQKMYAMLCQKDVAVVGARFLKAGFAVENCGYIFDENGISYPAFYGQKIYQSSYEQFLPVPRDVASVDGSYCMIDAKVYRKLGGFDPNLSGRDVMLDFCIRAKKAGYRTVVDPSVLVRNYAQGTESSQSSNEILREKHQEYLMAGDDYYNPNLPMGIENYRLDEF